MKVIKKTKEYTVYQKSSGRYGVKNASKNWVNADEKVAILKVVYDDEIVGEYDLLASIEVKKVNFVSRLLKSLNYLIWGDV